ncbi:MAG: ABC transporter ATP-binding protein [Candidatus Electrothrix sp. AS4_5]|nr:ABC transporter ATP-binding protein [Candidatus Electrothrix gigas]MCI5189783.1 ABC transporter ATP-binding protein [Candidatus Electrothrix gigas]
MSSAVIKIENLWKEYRLGVIGHGTLTHDLQSWWAKMRGKEDPNAKITPILAGQEKQIEGDRFWALRDINLEVKEGEILGIIGKNGAGKSTLLKILSRVTAPTKGSIKVKGRIASLLEVGTGFHPELTGRENIFMNGAILGMSSQEIKSKLDEIIDFSGVENFIDTPVKRYSSGMYVRLAFAVAAHLEPEILVVDEVLAVGDAEFQKKCLGKMNEVAHEGRTVLFVSHNMPAVQNLCTAGVVFEMGRLVCNGPIEKALDYYLIDIKAKQNVSLMEQTQRQGSGWLRITRVELVNESGRRSARAISGQEMCMRLHYLSDKNFDSARVQVAFNLKNSLGLVLANVNAEDSGCLEQSVYSEGWFECRCPDFPLRAGHYNCTLFCSVNGEIVDSVQNGYRLEVIDGDFHGSGRLIDRNQGDFLIRNRWTSHDASGKNSYS